MKFNIKNLVLPISIIASISGNCSNAVEGENITTNSIYNSNNNSNARLENIERNNNMLVNSNSAINNDKNNRRRKAFKTFKKKKGNRARKSSKELVKDIVESFGFTNNNRHDNRHNIININGVHNINIRKDFKIDTEDYYNGVLYNLAKSNNNISDDEKDYIKNIMISINETKDNWYDTTLSLSQEQNNTINNLKNIHDVFLNSFKIKSNTHNNMMCRKFEIEKQELVFDLLIRNSLTDGMYYTLLQEVNNNIFTNSYYMTSSIIDNLLKNIKSNTTDTPDEYKSFLQWLLYCGINNIISLSEDNIRNSIQQIAPINNNGNPNGVNLIDLIKSYVFKGENVNQDNISVYKRNIKVINIILKHLLQSYVNQDIVKPVAILNANNKYKMQQQVSQMLQIQSDDELQEYIENNLGYLFEKNNTNDDKRKVFMQRVNNVVKLIVDYSYKILCKKFNIQYDSNFMNYNDNIQHRLGIKCLRNSNFDFITQFYNEFTKTVNNYEDSLDNDTKTKLHEILKDSEIEKLMDDWNSFIFNYPPMVLKLQGDSNANIYNRKLSAGNSNIHSIYINNLLYNYFKPLD